MSCSPIKLIEEITPHSSCESEGDLEILFQIDENITDEQKEEYRESREFQSAIQKIKSQPDKFELDYLIAAINCCYFLDHQDIDLFSTIALECSIPNRLNGFEPSSMVKFIATYLEFNMREEHLFKAIASECIQQSRLIEFKTNEIVELTSAYYIFRFKNIELFREIAKELIKENRREEITFEEISMILSIYFDFRFKDKKLFELMGTRAAKIIKEKPGSIDIKNLALLALSYTEMNIDHEDLFHAVLDLCNPKKLQTGEANYLASIFYSLIANEYYIYQDLKAIMDCLNKKYQDLSDAWLDHIYMAIKLCQSERSHLKIKPSQELLDKLHEYLKRLKNQQKNISKHTERYRSWHYAIREALSKEQKHVKAHYFAEFCFVDIAVTDKKIGILIDDTLNYTSKGEPIGYEQIKTLLLEYSGWKIFRIPWNIWHNKIKKEQFLNGLTEEDERLILELLHEMPDYKDSISKRNCINLYAHRACFNCHKLDSEKLFKICARCKVALYCSPECQREDWKNHKKFCKKGSYEEMMLSALQKIEIGELKEAKTMISDLNSKNKVSFAFSRVILAQVLHKEHTDGAAFLNPLYLVNVRVINELFFFTKMVSLFPNSLQMLDPEHQMKSEMTQKSSDVKKSFSFIIGALESCESDYDILYFIIAFSRNKIISREIFEVLLNKVIEKELSLSAEKLLLTENMRNMMNCHELKRLLSACKSEDLRRIAEEQEPKKMAMLYKGKSRGKFTAQECKIIARYEELVDYYEHYDFILDCCLNHRFHSKSFRVFRFDEYTDFEILDMKTIKRELIRICDLFDNIDKDILVINLFNITSEEFLNLPEIAPFEERVAYLLSKIIAMFNFLEQKGLKTELLSEIQHLANYEYQTPSCYINTFIEICMNLEMLCHALKNNHIKIAKGLFLLYRSLNSAALGITESMVREHYKKEKSDLPAIILFSKQYLSQKINFLQWRRHYTSLIINKPENIDDFLSGLAKRFGKIFKNQLTLYKLIDSNLSEKYQIELIPLLLNHMPENTVALNDTLSVEDIHIAKELLKLEENLFSPRNVEYLLDEVCYSKYNLYSSERIPIEDLMIKPQAFIHLLKAMNIIKRSGIFDKDFKKGK